MKFNPRQKKDFQLSYNAMINSVDLFDNTSIFGKKYYQSKREIVDYSNNSLVFNFSSTYYYRSEKNKFSYILEGNDTEWSDWKMTNSATYTNLEEGAYVFKVKAKNIYGKESIKASFSFVILPPCYRTWWAYLAYVLIVGGIIRSIILLNQKRLKAENRRLEGIVYERTVEIRAQKEAIEGQNKVLEEKNHEIEEKNHDIISSITYAKRIQEAILPSDSLVESLYPKSFILYKPKDIVSGDFYWVEEGEQFDYFSVVDCTGHGVPGAFVSIVGRNGLDKTVKDFVKEACNEILDHLTDIVIDTFSKNDKEEIKDGMDIALCALSKDRRVVHFSGANNPLWLIRSREEEDLQVNEEVLTPNLMIEESDYKLFEVKADPQPIGKYIDRQKFTLSNIVLKPGDTIYIFSDGYADQFGGPRGKKFLSNRFKKLLLSIQELNMNDQKVVLDQSNIEWMKSEEQLDDICVIGVKIKF